MTAEAKASAVLFANIGAKLELSYWRILMRSDSLSLTQKIQSLTPEQVLKVSELVDSLTADDQRRAMLVASEPAFSSVWNDPENDLYDSL